MRAITIALLSASLLLCFVGLLMQNPRKQNEELYRAHNRLERMADRKEGSEDFRDAVLKQRIYMNNAEFTRGLGRPILWLGLGMNLSALIMVQVGWKKEAEQDGTGNDRAGSRRA